MSSRDRLATTLAFIIAFGALCYLAPLEYGAAKWLGLPYQTAWTLTVVIEGFLALALVAGRWVPFALALTWTSATLGQAHAADVLTDNPDWYRAGSSVVVTSVMVAALAGTHAMLRALAERRSEQDERERERLAAERERRANAERERAERLANAERERAERERAERNERERANAERERARSFAESERTREWNAERERERQAEIALAALKVEAVKATKAATPAVKPPRVSIPKASNAERELVYKEWCRREDSGEPMSTAELATALGSTDSAARGQRARWAKARADSAIS